MKRERRQPTRREWAAITSRRPVVRKIRADERSSDAPTMETTPTADAVRTPGGSRGKSERREGPLQPGSAPAASEEEANPEGKER